MLAGGFLERKLSWPEVGAKGGENAYRNQPDLAFFFDELKKTTNRCRLDGERRYVQLTFV